MEYVGAKSELENDVLCLDVLFSHEEMWTKLSEARVRTGKRLTGYVGAKHPRANCFCLHGGISRILPLPDSISQNVSREQYLKWLLADSEVKNRRTRLIGFFLYLIKKHWKQVNGGIIYWNDDPHRKFEDVRKLLELAKAECAEYLAKKSRNWN